MTVTICESLSPTPALIEALRSNQLIQAFSSHPSTVTTGKAIAATQAGFGLIYRLERDHAYGRELAVFLIDIFRLIFWPLIALALTGIATVISYLFSNQFLNALTSAYLWLLNRFSGESAAANIEQLIADSLDEREVI